jgi:hypothetical protein
MRHWKGFDNKVNLGIEGGTMPDTYLGKCLILVNAGLTGVRNVDDGKQGIARVCNRKGETVAQDLPSLVPFQLIRSNRRQKEVSLHTLSRLLKRFPQDD